MLNAVSVWSLNAPYQLRIRITNTLHSMQSSAGELLEAKMYLERSAFLRITEMILGIKCADSLKEHSTLH